MTQPKVTITELDGALGILPPSAGRLLVVMGVASQGPKATPATYARVTDLVATFGEGPGVEAAAHYITRTGNPVVFIRTDSSTAASEGTVVHTGTGASVASVHTGTHADDDLEIVILITLGGTVGTGPISFKYSLDGGRTYSAEQSLGTATFYVIPGTGGLRVDFTTAATVTGDTYAFPTTGPMWDSTNIGAAFDALKASAVSWELVHVVGAISATLFDAIETNFAGLATAGKYRAWMGSVRMPDVGESEATYLSSLTSAFASKSTKLGMLCAGACRVVSAVSGRIFRRPSGFPIASLQADVDIEVDIAALRVGQLVGIAIRDNNGNVVEHDESVNPGLDDARFTVLRSWEGVEGVYCNRPRIFSATGSDFQLMPHRRVLNAAHAALRAFFLDRLSLPVLVNPKTGFIRESEALEIEAGAKDAMRAAVLARPSASAVDFVLSRTDNVLSTKTLNGTARVTPLAYPEFISLEVGFTNPALQTQSAA